MRHKKIEKREVEEDSIYRNKLVTKLINYIMKSGKKAVAQNVVYEAFSIILGKNQNPVEVFERAIQSVGPKQEVKAKRVGGASYQIPMEVRGERRVALALRWIIDAARSRSTKEYGNFSNKLASEFLDVIEGKGEAVKKRDAVARMAQANRAFSHFRW